MVPVRAVPCVRARQDGEGGLRLADGVGSVAEGERRLILAGCPRLGVEGDDGARRSLRREAVERERRVEHTLRRSVSD